MMSTADLQDREEKQATGPGLEKRFALFDLLKSLYSDTKILSKYIPSLSYVHHCEDHIVPVKCRTEIKGCSFA
jgi:hypothetical protein